jgi:hypothetical protein
VETEVHITIGKNTRLAILDLGSSVSVIPRTSYGTMRIGPMKNATLICNC